MATIEKQTYKNLIGGEWTDAASGETFESIVPANGEILGAFPKSAREDVDRAVAAAKAAYEQWRLTPAPKRADVLYRFAELLRDRKQELTELMSREMGKVLAEAGGDVQEAIDMSLYMAGEGRRLWGQTTPSELPDKFNMSVRTPVGVVGVITPWNFPIAIPAWKIAPAIVCGNTVVFKPAEDTPLLAERFVELLSEAGLPDGVVNIVHGYGEEAGDALVRHPDVPIITFTGSRETGVAVTHATADALKHVHLELGGKNAIIVMDDADLDLAVDGIVWSAFGTSGQRCTAASRVIAHETIHDALQSKLVHAAESLRLGAGWDAETDVGPVINKAAIEKIHSYTQIGRDEGATLLTGGEVASEGELGRGFFYRPTIFANAEPGMRIAQEEIFGPTTTLLRVSSFEEAVSVANGIKYGLSSAIYTRDVNRAFRAMRDLNAGITYVNAGTIGAEVHLPFGGTKDTGNGHREAGQAALDVFTEWKSIYVDYSGKLQKAQIDTAS
jgi:aldehyde dehydrogenase (NAD+)